MNDAARKENDARFLRVYGTMFLVLSMVAAGAVGVDFSDKKIEENNKNIITSYEEAVDTGKSNFCTMDQECFEVVNFDKSKFTGPGISDGVKNSLEVTAAIIISVSTFFIPLYAEANPSSFQGIRRKKKLAIQSSKNTGL